METEKKVKGCGNRKGRLKECADWTWSVTSRGVIHVVYVKVLSNVFWGRNIICFWTGVINNRNIKQVVWEWGRKIT